MIIPIENGDRLGVNLLKCRLNFKGRKHCAGHSTFYTFFF
jgi:hypothetical protein